MDHANTWLPPIVRPIVLCFCTPVMALGLSMKTKTYLGMAALAAIATFAKQQGILRANEAFSILVSPDIFEPAAFGALFVVGLLLVTSTPRPSCTKSLALRLHSVSLVSFSGVAGGIVGWGVMVSLLHVVANGATQIPAALVLGGLAVLLTVAPLWMYEQVHPIFAAYSSFRLSQRRGMFLLQSVGWIISCAAVFGFLSWLVKG